MKICSECFKLYFRGNIIELQALEIILAKQTSRMQRVDNFPRTAPSLISQLRTTILFLRNDEVLCTITQNNA